VEAVILVIVFAAGAGAGAGAAAAVVLAGEVEKYRVLCGLAIAMLPKRRRERVEVLSMFVLLC